MGACFRLSNFRDPIISGSEGMAASGVLYGVADTFRPGRAGMYAQSRKGGAWGGVDEVVQGEIR